MKTSAVQLKQKYQKKSIKANQEMHLEITGKNYADKDRMPIQIIQAHTNARQSIQQLRNGTNSMTKSR